MATRFTEDTKDPAVNVTTWCLLVVMILSVLSRLGTKVRLFRRLIADDLLIITSLIFGVGQSVAVSLAVGSGYGKHLKDVTNHDLDQMMKEIYAASLLCILGQLFSKLSMVVFIRRLTPSFENKRVGPLRRFGMASLAWRYFIGISNIGTELLILTQAMIVMLIIQSWGLRMVFAGIFVPRTLVISAIIVQLVFTKNGVRSTDESYNMCELTIFDVIVQCLSVVTACWPQLKPFLSWVRSNGLKIQDVEDQAFRNSKTRPLSQTWPTSPGLNFEEHESLALARQDQIFITTSWEVDSQSSHGGTAKGDTDSSVPRCSIN
ncbi:hypothetical protein N7513_004700 [Penicillium frequentans]|nr:hypothetical protein N7513_007009 [Penicillium glabrum]KAJ5547466.1 hypothetical protein N7513_004700 [Penicillium glabrum]